MNGTNEKDIDLHFLTYGDLIPPNNAVKSSSPDNNKNLESIRKINAHKATNQEIQIPDTDDSDDNNLSLHETSQEQDISSEEEIVNEIKTKEETNDIQESSSAKKKRSKRKKKIDCITKEDIEKFIKDRNFKGNFYSFMISIYLSSIFISLHTYYTYTYVTLINQAIFR